MKKKKKKKMMMMMMHCKMVKEGANYQVQDSTPSSTTHFPPTRGMTLFSHDETLLRPGGRTRKESRRVDLFEPEKWILLVCPCIKCAGLLGVPYHLPIALDRLTSLRVARDFDAHLLQVRHLKSGSVCV